MRKQKYNCITATLCDDLYWLPIWQCVSYKQCTMVYKCLHMTAPVCLSEMCVPVIASKNRSIVWYKAHFDTLNPFEPFVTSVTDRQTDGWTELQ